MKKYTGATIEEILEDVSIEEGIDTSLIHYNIESKTDEEITINVFTDADIIEFIEDYIQKFFNNLDQTVHVDARYSDGMYRIFINASNNAVVIGKDGATLQSFTNVIRSATNSHFKKHIKLLWTLITTKRIFMKKSSQQLIVLLEKFKNQKLMQL